MPRPQPPQRVATNQSKPRDETIKTSEYHRFTSGDSVKSALRATDVSQLTTNLTSLRNQWTIHHHGSTSIAADDARLLLAKSYLELSPTASEVFSAWELLSKQSIVHQHLALGVFAALLNLLSTQYIYHSLGLPVLRALLAPQSNRKLNAHLNSAQTDLVLVALKLWNAMSDYASGVEKKNVYEAFQWGNKSLFGLYHMRRKGQVDPSLDPFIKPDIRTLYMTFMLGFLQPSTPHMLKSNFLESHRELFLGLFKRVSEDPYAIVRFILETCWEGIWADNKLKRTLKIGLFNVQTLSLLVKLYSRVSTETTDPESVPADLVHHFLLALCTRPGVGLCFKDDGWYPREDGDQKDGEEPDDRTQGYEERRHGTSKIYNVVIGQLLKHLKPTEDARQQELVLRIFEACPELISGYWSGSGMATEPRLSSKWLINIAWLNSIISLPVPTKSFLLKLDSMRKEYQPYPPPLQVCLDNIVPPVWPKTFITKGLQGTSPLVQRSTALCLAQVLEKYDAVLQAFREAESALEEDEESGQWKLRRKDIEREIRKRIPNFEVIIAFSQQKSTSLQWGADLSAETSERTFRSAMISESALRLMWAYHHFLPDVPSEARYDVGKLLLNDAVQRLSRSASNTSPKIAKEIALFDSLSVLHILRLLQHSDQIVWTSTLGDTNQTQFCHLLRIYVLCSQPVLLQNCTDVLQSALAHSDLFDHDPSELNIWLDSLPRTIRSPTAKGPDDDELVDERETMIAILDKCIRECIKAPWTFVEACLSVYTGSTSEPVEDSTEEPLEGYSPATAASPLLMTLLEMFEGLWKGLPNLASSTTLAVATYLRRVIFGLSLKQPNAQYARRIVSRLYRVLSSAGSPHHSISMVNGIKREIDLLENALSASEHATEASNAEDKREVLDFLERLESLQIDSENTSTTAYDLVDWIRLSGRDISPNELLRMVALVQAWYPPALRDLILQVDPSQLACVPTLYSTGYLERVSFPWAYLHLSIDEFENSDLLDALAALAASESPDSIRSICNLFIRRVESAHGKSDEAEIMAHVLGLWSRIAQKVEPQKRKMHQDHALGSPAVQRILRKTDGSHDLQDGVAKFVSSLLDSSSAEDHTVAREFCIYWVKLIIDNDQSVNILPYVLPWVPFMFSHEHIAVLDRILHSFEAKAVDPQMVLLMNATLQSLDIRSEDTIIRSLIMQRLPRLLALQEKRKDHHLDTFINTVMSTMVPSGFIDGPSYNGVASSWSKDVEARWRTARRTVEATMLDEIARELSFNLSSTLDITIFTFYRSQRIRHQVAALLLATEFSIEHVGLTLYQIFNSSTPEDSYLGDLNQRFASTIVKEALSDAKGNHIHLAQRTLRQMFSLCDNQVLSSVLLEHYSTSHNISSLCFAGALAEDDCITSLIAAKMLHISMKDIVSLLSEQNHHVSTRKGAMVAIVNLAKGCKLQAESLEAFFSVCVRDYLSDGEVMKAFVTLVRASTPKPATVNRLLQATLHHPQFESVANSVARNPMVAALYALFQTQPQNTYQPSHIAPLIAIYRGTLAETDRQLLDIFRTFEKIRKYSCSSIISKWNPTPNMPQATAVGAIADLDSTVMFRSCTEFPAWRKLEQESESQVLSSSESALYDPLFVVLFLGMFSIDIQVTGSMTSMDWLQLFRSNAVCLLIRTLSAREDQMRALAWNVFGALLQTLQAAEFHEKAQTIYILQMLARLYNTPGFDRGGTPRLPSITTLFFAHALRILFTPSSTFYPLMSRFLLQRPEFDPHDPPMLYSMLYSGLSSESWKKEGNWKRERIWILKFLADGMVSTQDWEVLKRRHTWDLLATTFTAQRHDRAIRMAVLKVLHRICHNQTAATSLILRNNLLSWIEIQVRQIGTTVADDSINLMWYQILERLIVSAEYVRVENGTRGSWRADILRSLQCLLAKVQPSQTENAGYLQTMLCAARIVQRVSQLPDPTVSIGKALHDCVDALRRVEKFVIITLDDFEAGNKPLGPETQSWVEIVCRLWLTLMGIGDEGRHDVSDFGSLTSRMVAFTSYSNLLNHSSLKQDVAMWARRESQKLLSIIS